MPKILYVGFGDLVPGLQAKLSHTAGVEFKEILQFTSETEPNHLDDADVFMVGPFTIDPVRQVQRASQQNGIISIVLLAFPNHYQRIKQALQIAYQVSKNVNVIPYEIGKDITSVIDGAITRSVQRKSFARIQEKQVYPVPGNRDITFENLNVFLANAPIGAIVFDQAKRVISSNYKAKNAFKILETRANLSWSDLFQDEFLPESPNLTDTGIHEVIKVNNLFLEINISPLLIEKSKPHFLLLINDVTDKIDVENQLKGKVDELEFLNRELDDFINVVSHDFKTPLTSIGLLAEMAIKEQSQEKQLKFLHQIKASSNKLRDLLKGLNVLVDIKKNKSEKIEPVELQERFDIILSEYKLTLDEINGTVKFDFSGATHIPYFTAHIDSLFSNLITNAIKYRNQEVPLLVEVYSRKQKEYTIVSVKDNGTGIDLSKNMNKLFQPFKRLTDQGTGSGLGLSIIKRMIEQDHGYIEVLSEPGVGTEFRIYLKDQV
ncbi:MAG: HAMP domain-containing sensor histidine kinase [Daejeonella sp.]